MAEKIAIIGLGYVGLPLALALAEKHSGTLGFDVNERKLSALRAGADVTGEISAERLRSTSLRYVSTLSELKDSTFFIVAVPTPVDQQKRPDLQPLVGASEAVGKALTPGAVVVYESTVYPGVTEDVCGPILERVSGLKRGVDFKLGYSPERINPGDREHTLEKVIKIVAGEDDSTLDRVASVYESVVSAGVHRAPSIKVAEAAKVIENIQRDLNIALMNELAIIFDRMGIRTRDVLAASGTKWNFLPFKPGLVGGHCIGVDPYYLTSKAEELGYHPQVILAGRRINDNMGVFVAQKLVKLMVQGDRHVNGARVGILGLTFKENVPDLRNSRVPDIVAELKQFGMKPVIHDPLASKREAHEEYGIDLTGWEELTGMDALVIAVPHQFYKSLSIAHLCARVCKGGVIVDVRSMLNPAEIPDGLIYWSL